jgi:glycosyltransferase involved in cell wall biosynthesis
MHESYNPFVSVVTPFYNGEIYLVETIESVIRQEYANWELLLIDDGSSDGATRIAKSYSSKYPGKIYYLEHDNHANKGPSASRNLGMAKASGELLAFLDSDDYWLPEKLKIQVELLKQYPDATALCEATKFWSSWSDHKNKDVVLQVAKDVNKLYYAPDLASLVYPLGKGSGFCTCGLIVKKKLLDKIGGFDEGFTGKNQLYEDQVLFVKLYLHANVYISSECNNFYRQRPDSLMHGLYTEGYSLQGKLFFLDWLKAYLEKKSIMDKDIYRALKKAYMPYRYPVLYKLSGKTKSALRRIKNKFTGYIKTRTVNL